MSHRIAVCSQMLPSFLVRFIAGRMTLLTCWQSSFGVISPNFWTAKYTRTLWQMVLFSRSEFWPRKAPALVAGNRLYQIRYASFQRTWCVKCEPLYMCLSTARLAFRQGLLHLELLTYLRQSFTYSATAVSCVTILMARDVLSFLISFRRAATISSMLVDELPSSSDPLIPLFTNNSRVASISGKSSSAAS